MARIATDVRYALRRWIRRPGLALVATLVLALGIGATTAVFSIVDAVLLRPEPWPVAERLVAIYGVLPQQRTNPAYSTRWNRSGISWAAWRNLQQSPVFDDVGVWSADQRILGEAQAELVPIFYASSSLLPLFGVQPAVGRLFNAHEDSAPSDAIILSHRTWQRHFGGRTDVVGKTAKLSRPGESAVTTRTVVGVLPADFRFPGEVPEALIPMGDLAYAGSFEANSFLRAIGRLASNTSVSAAFAAAEPLVRRQEPPDRRTARLVTLKEDRVGQAARPLWLMLAGAALLLVVACSNVAGLLLGDARVRHHETAVRLALGGSRGSILRQLTVEHQLLAFAAGAGGLVLALWIIPVFVLLAPTGLIGADPLGLDPRIAAWSIAVAVLTTLVAGVIPSVAISSTKPGDALKHGSREATRGGRWRHRAIVAAQFSLALVLLVGAGVFGETLIRLGGQPLGFVPDGVAVATVVKDRPVSKSAPLTPEERAKYMELRRTDTKALSRWIAQAQWPRMQARLDRVAGLPGVRAVATTRVAPFTGTALSAKVRADGRPADEDQIVQWHLVSERYFDAMGIAVVRGRAFEASDRTVASSVVVSAELDRRVFGGNAVGRRLLAEQEALDVIGVVSDVKQRELSDDDVAAVYRLVQSPDNVNQIIVRTTGDARAILPLLRQTLESRDDPMIVRSTATMEDLVAGSIAEERGRAMLSGVYGAAALLLASVGLYGLAARLVAERRREIGIRIALGAGRRHVRKLVMSDAWMIVGVGLVVGVPSAIGATRLTRGLLFGVEPAAPHVFALAATALAAAAILSTLVPALRANRVDPAVALRDDGWERRVDAAAHD